MGTTTDKIPDERAREARMVAPTHHVPSLISWNLTRRCNLRCPHCYMDAGAREEEELTTEECLAIVDELRSLGTEMVILTGGEPLLRRDIYDIALRASESGMWVVMGTNGVLVNDHVASRMVACGVKGVGISIDSIDPEKHNTFRGGPNAWEHSVRAIKTCRAHGLQVLMQTTVMEMNRDEVPELMAFARDLGVWSFNLYFLVQTGRGQEMNDLSAARTRDVLEDMVDLQDAFRPMLVRSKCAPQFKQIAYAAGKGGLESGGCMAGISYARITPSGDVTPCPYMDPVAGSVRSSSFTDIWRNSPLLQSLRQPDLLGGRCGACEFRELCGGCRCRAYAATGNVLAEDPACTYQPTGGPPLSLPGAEWSPAARQRLERIPIDFIRARVRRGVEAFAQRAGEAYITETLMDRALPGFARPEAPFSRLPLFSRPTRPEA